MDVVEFAERFMNIELLEYQKQFLRDLENLRSNGDVRICMGKHRGVYIYLDRKAQKELVQNGTALNHSI